VYWWWSGDGDDFGEEIKALAKSDSGCS